MNTISPLRSKNKISEKNKNGEGWAALREIVLVEQDIVVCGLARAEYSLVAAQIKVPLDRARHDRIYDCPRRTVRVARRLAAFGDGGLGEKDKFVFFADDDKCDGRIEA